MNDITFSQAAGGREIAQLWEACRLWWTRRGAAVDEQVIARR